MYINDDDDDDDIQQRTMATKTHLMNGWLWPWLHVKRNTEIISTLFQYFCKYV